MLLSLIYRCDINALLTVLIVVMLAAETHKAPNHNGLTCLWQYIPYSCKVQKGFS